MTKSQRSYAIIGTGAVGGFYGARLQKAGLDVHYLLHRDYQQVMQSGLIIESVDGDFTLPQVQAYASVEKMPACDVVIVALKTTQNHLLPQLLPPVLKDSGVVLLLQNGLDIESTAFALLNNQTLLSGLCFICSNKVAPGHIRHLDYSAITLGQYGKDYQAQGITEPLRQVAQDFESAGIPMQLTEDLMFARWQKLVWNIPYNGLSVILDARTDEIMGNADSLELVKQLMQEVLAGAKSCDRHIPTSFIDKMLDHTANMKPYKTSMKLDYDHQQPLELNAIFGNPLKLATGKGATLPQITTLYRQLRFLDTRNRQ